MKFTVNTKPLKDALAIAIVDSNVSRYYQKSTLVQLTMEQNHLRINTEANAIMTEVSVYGHGECNGGESILIDALLFKKLINTISATQMDIEFSENAVSVRTASGSYNLPKMLDTSEAQLNRPESLTDSEIEFGLEVDTDSWKYIKSHQMFARATTDEYPVYTYVFFGEGGDVLVGDYKSSIFTHSSCGILGEDCLISESIVNMFNSIPDNARLIKKGENYIVNANTDAFTFTASFVPRYESDELGRYNSDIFIELMSTFNKEHISIKSSDITTVLNQVQILSKRLTKLHLCISGDTMTLSDVNMKSTIHSDVVQNQTYEVNMNPDNLRNVISHCPDATLDIYPAMNGENIVGIMIASGSMTVVIAGVE